MAQYKFPLQTLQKLRKIRRDQVRTALADAFRAEEVLAGHRRELAAEEASLRDVQRQAAVGKYLDVNRLVEAQRYDLVLKARTQELARQDAVLAAEIERRRLALVEADREVRTLELLEDRQRSDFRRRQRQLESRELDEIALARQRNRQP